MQKLLSKSRQAIKDFNMIEENDKINSVRNIEWALEL